jgi:hypothetical protein
MPVSWNQLKEAAFDRDAYPACDHFGVWEAVVDAAAYSRGSRMTAQGKGGRAGIHLFVRSVPDAQKFWLYVLFFPTSAVYQHAQELKAGDRVRVETVHGKNDHAVVKSLEILR